MRNSVFEQDPLQVATERSLASLVTTEAQQTATEQRAASWTHTFRTTLYYVAIATMVLVLMLLLMAWQNQTTVFSVLTDHEWAFTIFITSVVGGLLLIRYNAPLGAGLIVLGLSVALIAIVYSFLF